MKTKSKTSGYIIRGVAIAVLLLSALTTLTSAFNLPNRLQSSWPFRFSGRTVSPAKQARTLTFSDRVRYQRGIEEVYWRHRIWPEERPDPKPSLDKVMSQAHIQKKVEDYLRNSQLLADYWQQLITPEQLQAEMQRMASQTKQPEVLRELFEALGNDPFVIAECLARPALAERLVTDLYAHDQRFHGELKRRAEAEVRAHPSREQMKQTSGTYRETEWIRTDMAKADSAPSDGKNVGSVRMTGTEWQENVEKLAAEFGTSRGRHDAASEGTDMSAHSQNAPSTLQRFNPSTSLPIGKLSSLQEDEGAYYATEVIRKDNDRLKLATIAWMKQPFDSWRAKAETQIPATMAVTTGIEYSLPVISDVPTTCTNDTWTATSTTNAPSARFFHTAVWTGSEMIVWGGSDTNGNPLNTGGRYNPGTDSWIPTTTTNAPEGRGGHTAVWTGSEMIVWGGANAITDLNTGGRYNPSTNSWTATSTTNAPSARNQHTAVWTGSEMIVWGGYFYNGSSHFLNTGGRYNPTTDTWTATSTTHAPSARTVHTAVRAGSEMIVWGGLDANFNYVNTGGRYSPGTNTWTATNTANAPSGRYFHSARWTGSEMIVWGGSYFDGSNFIYLKTGGRYNPTTDSWIATSLSNAPSPRDSHTAVWTGSEMIVWGGHVNTGGGYNPRTNSWTATSTANAPSARHDHTAVWTGSEMIVWGGSANGALVNTGGKYCAGSPPQLGNISTRAFVQTGDNVMIGGFIVQGTEAKRVIIRALGPELTQYGVPNVLANPTLELHNGSGALIASNDNWVTTIIGGIIPSGQVRDIRSSGYAPTDERESAIIAELPPGNYTAIVRGVSNATGVALVEVYELGPSATSILRNISTRSFVQTGDNVMIGGFIVAGTEPRRVIVRAIGPELTQYGVPNVLANPTLELHNGTGALIASNNDWQTTIIGGIIISSQVSDIQNSGHAPTAASESAIIAELPAGNYTAIVRGVNNTTGVALVDVYDLD